jgi:hypothetical protein
MCSLSLSLFHSALLLMCAFLLESVCALVYHCKQRGGTIQKQAHVLDSAGIYHLVLDEQLQVERGVREVR